ncbi:MAG: hypothetical protein NTV22_02965 [bacterium]|nr:hypothetical protein [bacterium]
MQSKQQSRVQGSGLLGAAWSPANGVDPASGGVQGSGLQRKMILLQNHFVQNELPQFIFIAEECPMMEFCADTSTFDIPCCLESRQRRDSIFDIQQRFRGGIATTAAVKGLTALPVCALYAGGSRSYSGISVSAKGLLYFLSALCYSCIMPMNLIYSAPVRQCASAFHSSIL